MNNKILLLAAILSSAGLTSRAVQMTYSDNGAGTITQTYDSGSFQPGVPSIINITFAQFDTQGGALSLASVTVTVTQYAWGGYYAVDNDGATTASVTVQHGATGSIGMTPGYEYFLPVGAQSTLSTVVTSGGTVVLAANDGDATTVYNEDAGGDHYRLDGPTEANALMASANGTRTSGIEAYSGTGNLSLDYTVSQSSLHVGEGALYYSGGPAYVQTLITVTYEYVPEPSSLALLAAGCAVLGLRRRGRAAKAI